MTSLGALGKELVSRWLSLVYTPAFSFWAGGVAIVIYSEANLKTIEDWLNARSDIQLALLAVGALVIVAVSGEMVQRCDRWVIRWLEGYWPPFLNPLRRLLKWLRKRAGFVPDQKRWNELATMPVRNAEQNEEYADLEGRLRWIPAEPAARMPTALGDALKAAELRPHHKYKMDSVLLWPRLWLLLPEEARNEVSTARAALDAGASLFLWGVLFIISWAYWHWIAAPIGLLVCIYAYFSMVADARNFGDLIESVFDLYRWKLYEALRWPLPRTPAEEQLKGLELTRYVLRGSDEETRQFAHNDDGQ